MQRVSDLHDLAKILFAAGYKADVSPGDPRADWLGFIDEFHVHRLYLRQRIDFQWLASSVELLPPITKDEPRNLIADNNGVEICGGTEPPRLAKDAGPHRDVHPRLRALIPVMEELRALRCYLEDGSRKGPDRSALGQQVTWVDDSLRRMESQLHKRWWPPVWWRWGTFDIDLLRRDFHRVDSEGAYFDPSRPGENDAYIPERDEILRRIDQIGKMFERARQGAID